MDFLNDIPPAADFEWLDIGLRKKDMLLMLFI